MISEQKARLLDLEETGKYVFHGSETKLEMLEPRQAHNYDASNKKQIPDGKPAIFASQFAEAAIFKAIINKKNCPEGHHAGFNYEDQKMHYRATKKTLDQLNPSLKGFVHVFSAEKFTPRNHFETVTFESIQPVEVIEVSTVDLPESISVIQ